MELCASNAPESRVLRNGDSSWPIFRIDRAGRLRCVARLLTVGRSETRVSGLSTDWLRGEFAGGAFPGVPWFLEDQKPQGFLGHRLARRLSTELGVSPDMTLWDDDDVLTYLLTSGGRGTGDLLLGEVAAHRALARSPDVISESARGNQYGDLAMSAASGRMSCDQVAGEQPKFTATVIDAEGAIRHVIVKFTEPAETGATAQRWADLLICEHLAGQLLAEQGNASAPTELIWSQGRLCLEATRFDRIGAYGRRGCVSLAAWSDAHDGDRDDWASAAKRMHEAGWIDDASLAQVRQRWWFGRLIGNTDMHFGNLSFFLDDTLPMAVTPSYDMLPMLYRPASNGALPPRVFQPAVPTPGDMHYWQSAVRWAETYWTRVSQHANVSEGFRDIAKANLEAIARLRERFDT